MKSDFLATFAIYETTRDVRIAADFTTRCSISKSKMYSEVARSQQRGRTCEYLFKHMPVWNFSSGIYTIKRSRRRVIKYLRIDN